MTPSENAITIPGPQHHLHAQVITHGDAGCAAETLGTLSGGHATVNGHREEVVVGAREVVGAHLGGKSRSCELHALRG